MVLGYVLPWQNVVPIADGAALAPDKRFAKGKTMAQLMSENPDKKEDYIDFLEQSKLNEESFLLAYAYQNGICEAFSINDEDAEDRIEQYRRMGAELRKKHVVLFDCTYDDGDYYVFEVSEKEFEDKWNIGTVNRIV